MDKEYIDELFPDAKSVQEPFWVVSREAQEWFDELNEVEVFFLYGTRVTPFGIEKGYITIEICKEFKSSHI